MADSALASIFTYAGWTFLPGYVTGLLQQFYYKVTIPAGRAHPQPGQPTYARHHRRIRTLVLCLYLVYTLVQGLYDIRLAGDFYTDLGVTPYTSERDVKARFRRLAAKYHPDKIRENDPASPVIEAAFVHLKSAQDTILNPVKRFAYDRFGPAIVQLQHPGLKTIRDYVYVGLRSLAPEYAKGAAMLVVMNYFYLPPWGQYWRYYAIASLVFLELYFLTHTWEPPHVVFQYAKAAHHLCPALLPPHLIPFQILSLARRMSLSVNIFISQLAPPMARNKADRDRQVQQQIAHLDQGATRLEDEASGLLNLGLAPFKGDDEKTEMLRRGMKDNIVMGAVRNSPEVRQAVRLVLDRQRPCVPD